jgi:polar amino acid transport system permease protein
MEFTFWDILRNLLFATRWTLLLSIVAFVGGGLVGLAVLLLRISGRKWALLLAKAYIELFQGTPLLMQLFLVFFGLPKLGLRMEPFGVAAITLTLCASAYLAEIWRGGVDSISRGQWDAAASLGLHSRLQLRLIILPQAFHITRAPTVGFLVQLVKATAVTSIIGFEELLRTANAITNATFEPLKVYACVATIYFVICYFVSRYAKLLELRGT